MMNYSSVELNDFSGGMTDYPFSAPLNKAATLDNISIDPNKKPVQRPGSQLAAITTPQLPSGEIRTNNFLPLDIEDIYYVGAQDRIFFPNTSGGYDELFGLSAADAPVFNAGSSGSFSSFAEWNKHWFGVNSAFAKPVKIFKDDNGDPQVRTAGLPIFGSTPTVVPAAGAGSRIWYFLYKYEYKVGDTTFIDLGSPIFVQEGSAKDPGPGADKTAITGIPVLANAGGTSYATTTITKQIYRTTNAGRVAYLVAEISNATTSYDDVTPDATLTSNEPIYTTGPNGTDGELAHDEPPLCKFMHIADGTAYYLYTKEGDDQFPFRVRQSTPGDPDSVPADFYNDLRDEGRGISSHNGRVIAFGTSKIYRFDGQFDELGRGGLPYEEISKITGCISHNSIVQTEFGVFFAGNTGFYWTDGYKVEKVSDSINLRYKAMLAALPDPRAIKGEYDPVNLKIYWATKTEDDSADNDSILCFDLRSFMSGVRDGAFTRWINEDVFNPTSIGFYKNQLYRSDLYGYVYKHSDDLATDPHTDPLKEPEDWGTKTIIWDIKTAHLNFGIPSVRKWVSQLLITARNTSNLSIQPYSINDDSSESNALKEIRFRDSLVWGDPEATWGDEDLSWQFQGLMEERRRFPAGSLRCSYKQIRLTNAYTVVTNSDTFSTVSINRTTKVATLDVTDLPWLMDLLGYDLVIKPNDGPTPDENDYSLTLPIESRDSDTEITLDDPTDTLNTDYPLIDGYSFDEVKWLIKGYPKNEIVNLMSLVIYYAPLTPTQKTFHGTSPETGRNAS